jgi:hypothetical protein
MKKALAAAAVGLTAIAGGAKFATDVDAGDRAVKGCVAAPLDGGTDCKRVVPGRRIDREARYFGAGNSFPAREAVGACESMPPNSCSGGE